LKGRNKPAFAKDGKLDVMSYLTYYEEGIYVTKELFVLRGQIKTPPLSQEARREAGYLLRMLQEGEPLGMPHARPMPVIGPRCLELRVNDAHKTWRLVCRVDSDAVIVVDIFEKKTRTTPDQIIQACRKRLKHFDLVTGE
jgi:phage-related protein